MKCCAECIGDRGLRKNIIPSLGGSQGHCGRCASQNVILVEPESLAEAFGTLISIYEQSDEGKSLVQILKEDWGMFDHPRMDDANAQVLLADILNDGNIVRKLFQPSSKYQSDGLKRWEKLRDELMHGNRYFPKVGIDEDRLAVLVGSLSLDPDEIPTKWYRARLLNQELPYTEDEMGAPSKKLASHGRANPAGIPYLYLGSTANTAVSEIRPHTGERACLAEFTTTNDLQVIDLRNPRKTVSPFLQGEVMKIGYMRADIPFLGRLGEELTRPVVPQSAAVDYVPSQYLCEFIKKCGFQGVLYRSSVGDGMNLALFYPDSATIGAISVRGVTRVSVQIT